MNATEIHRLARLAARNALDSARENGAPLGVDESEAAERVDDSSSLRDLLDGYDVDSLSRADARKISAAAVGMLIGYRARK